MESRNLTLSRFFSTGPAIVIAFDHGYFAGPIDGLENIAEIPGKIVPEVDAVLMSPGVLRDIGPDLCGHRHSPLAIVRINWSGIYCFQWNYHSGDTVEAYSAADALRLGAQMVLMSLSLNTDSEKRDTRNVEVFARLCREAHNLGIPVVGEYFPVNDEAMGEDAMYEEVKVGCRVLYELGADVIKTFYTKKFEEVVAGCPTPILALGGKRDGSDLNALKLAEQQIGCGASGIVFGRYVIQSEKPLELQKALLDVVKRGMKADEAAKKYSLD